MSLPIAASINASAAAADVAKSNNEFALELYQRAKGKEENLFFSPFSISSALAMTYGGARGETEKEMARVLHFDRSPAEVHAGFAKLAERIDAIGKEGKATLNLANSLWCQKDYPFTETFLNLTRDHYRAEARLVDFSGASENTRQEINAWVADKTQDKIRDLLQPGQVTGMTRLVLCNAIYFKGKWRSPFPAGATRPQPFFVSANRSVEVPLMTHKAPFRTVQTEELTLVALPYTGNDLSLIILLPKVVDGLNALKLDEPTLRGWLTRLDQARETEAELFLPRFKLNHRLELGGTLKEMGMRRAFGPQADFSVISGRGELFISDVVHQAFVDVNEEGTEAAAATGVGMRPTSMVLRTPVIRVDHPFVFLIRENQTGSVLFLGRVVDPTRGS